MFLKCFVFSLFFFICSNLGYSTEGSKDLQKMYVHPEQIEITQGAIAIYLPNGEVLYTDSIKIDEQGPYVVAFRNNRGPCGIHQVWCRVCGGCGVLLCPMNCICFD